MSTRRAAASRLLAGSLCALLALPHPPALHAQAAAPEEIIATVRSNGVRRGEFTLVRAPDGDFWIRGEDLASLQVAPRDDARRDLAGASWYSARALGATVQFDEPRLALDLEFRPESLPGTRIDLSGRPAPLQRAPARDSLVLSYRLGAIKTHHNELELVGAADLNVRMGGMLLRQEMHLDTTGGRRGVRRGFTQVIRDDLEQATRLAFGDVFSGAGPYGSTITGAGVLFSKVYDLAPELLRHPAARLQAATSLPAEVEVSVDGTSVYRGQVAPGPIALDNLLHQGGTRTVRVVITDAAGRRQVIEQPFLFTDTVLARGFHEYSYFAGARSELDRDSRLRYREPAWQAVHRYGLSDSLTVSAGGEGNRDFANAGAGIALRSDFGGLLGVDLLTSQDRVARTESHGWSARYAYLTPSGSFVLARRQFGAGFRTFATHVFNLFPRSETRVGVSSQLGRASVGADYVRTVTDAEVRDTGFLRVATSLGHGVTLLADWQATRAGGRKDWSASLHVRADLDAQRWTSSSLRADRDSRRVHVETGRLVPEGEGFGYRAGLATTHRTGARTETSAYGSADWNLRQASVGLFASVPVRGDGTSYLRAEVAGALVGLDGYWGFTRQITDSFVLARLGVPQKDVEILLNNLPQGRTDAQGRLLIPQVSSLGRQELSVNDQDLAIEYTLQQRQRTIAPPYRSGMVVDFGITKLRAVAGTAWQVDAGRRSPIASRAWTMTGPGGRLSIETATSGDFYLEDAPPGRYAGTLQGRDRNYACRLTVPESGEAVQELKDGIVCE